MKLNEQQMKGAGESTELLKNKQKLLEKELEVSGEKVSLLGQKLEKAKEIYGENSIEASNWGRKLADAKREEEMLGQELSSVNSKLNEQTQANKELESSIERTDTGLKRLDQELQLNATKMDGAKNKTELLKERQKLLSDQSKEAAEKTKLLQQALDTCEKEVGKNSEEYNELRSRLIDAKVQEEAIRNEIKKTTEELKNQKTAAEEVGDKLKKFGEGAEKLGSSMKPVSTAAAGVLAGTAAVAVSFESAFAGVKKTTDEVYDANGKCVYSYQQLEDGIRKMAKEIPASTTEISAVAEAAGQLGIKTEDILGFTRVMIDMGQSTNVSSEEAATAIAKFSNITGLASDTSMAAAEKYGRLGSTIVDLGNNYATTEADIIAMAQNLASAGTQVGMSEADILALATSLSSVGMEAQAGGTAFSKALVMMQLAVETNSESLQQWADVAGMSADEFATKFKEDATGALEAFIKGLSECGGETESAIKVLNDMDIKETRLRDSLLRSANASDVFSSAIQTGRDAWEENNALAEEAEKRYETTASQLAIMRNHIQDTGITLGSIFLPVITDVTKKISGFADKIAEMPKGTQKAILGITAFIAILAPMLIGIGKISTGISGIISISSKVGKAFSGIGTAAKAGGAAAAAGMSLPILPILAVSAGVVALIGIIALLWNKSESFRNFFTGMWENLKEVVSGFLEGIGINEKIEGIKETFSGLTESLGGLTPLFEVIGTILAVILVPALGLVAAGFSAIMSAVEPLIMIITGLVDMLAGIGSIIVGVFTGDLELAKQGADSFIKGIVQIFDGLWGLIAGVLSGFLSGLVSFFGSLLSVCGIENFVAGVKSRFESVKSSALNIFESIKGGIKSKIEGAQSIVKGAIDKIKGFFNFSWSLPPLKLPHISIKGKFSIDPPSVPKFGIEWYAKGAVFSKPTIFNAMNGWKGVGEAGPEAVAPITVLQSYVEEAVGRALERLNIPKEDPIDYDKLARSMEKVNISLRAYDREVARTMERAYDAGVL